jgi:cyclic pyranopterin phosphate synthase
MADEPRLSHIDPSGRARMVDVGDKRESDRRARARARVRMSPETAVIVERGDAPKGDVIGTARIAGIQAAKRTDELIPLAHPLPISFIDVEAEIDAKEGIITFTAEARTTARTGVEMEALTAAAVAALAAYDMVKGIERGVLIEEVALLQKTGGKEDWSRDT